MLEDKRLIWKMKRGCPEAGLQIYEKYKTDLLSLAAVLSHDKSIAEDIVHSVFVSFADKIADFELRTSLKSYLAICVSNRARNANKLKFRSNVTLDSTIEMPSQQPGPDDQATNREDLQRLSEFMKLLPYEQKEVIALHLKSGMKFKEIAKLQNVSINTVQSRYRYGLDKLKSLFNDEVIQ